MSEEQFDAIIVGAGPAGSACAYVMAKEGKNVLVIERADVPGSKNVTGGRIYTYAMETLDEGLTEEAALERAVTHEQTMVLDGERAITIDYHEPSYNLVGGKPQSYTVLRAKFDAWLASKAEEAGAIVACGIKVDDIVEENGKIVGIMAGDEAMYANVIIAADGVNSLIAQRAGLRRDISASMVGVGVKEIIELPRPTIEARFNLSEAEGAARMILGCTEGIHGGGFLYTNQESISLGCVFTPEEVLRHGKPVHSIFQELKMHPAIFPLIEGGRTVEYGAHLVSEAGYRGLPRQIYREGLLMIGDSAGFVINSGYSIRGIDLAILSGISAARAVIAAKHTTEMGSIYMDQLNQLNLMPTMKAMDGYADLMEIPRLYAQYPGLALEVIKQVYMVDGQVPASMNKLLKKTLKASGMSIWQLIKDGFKGVRAV